MKINCIIVEDEPLAMEQIEEFVGKISYLNLIGNFTNGLDVVSYLKDNEVDLMLLDIQMNDLTGIQLLESITKQPKVIITTAYDKYAIKGFELNVSDYLLKPYTFERFLQAIERVYEELAKELGKTDFFFVKTEYRLEKIVFNQILYIEGMRDYRRIHLTTKKVMTLQTFYEIEKELPYKMFCRVHKSYLVSLDKIDSIERDRIKIGNELIPISGTYKKDFYNKINGKNKNDRDSR